MRYLLDEDQSPRTAAVARRLGLDVLTVLEARRLGRHDPDQLDFAAEIGRVLVTRNIDDFVRYTREFAAQGRPHAGVLAIPRSIRDRDYAGIAYALAQYELEHPEGMPPYMLDFLRPVSH